MRKIDCFFYRDHRCQKHGMEISDPIICQFCKKDWPTEKLKQMKVVRIDPRKPEDREKMIPGLMRPATDEELTLGQRCLEICKQCDAATYERIKPDETKANVIVRFGSNLVNNLLNRIGVRELRCKECTCFSRPKAGLLKGRGCPRGKWPNDQTK